jgi:hypothetical protein
MRWSTRPGGPMRRLAWHSLGNSRFVAQSNIERTGGGDALRKRPSLHDNEQDLG